MRFTLTMALAVVAGGLTLQAQPPKVGTFNSRAVALAFYNSDHWSGIMKAKVAERNSAKQTGNQERVSELEKWGQAQQDLAHKQVFGSAPIPNVLEHLGAGFPEIAKAAGVGLIVSDVHYADPSVQKIDVTMHILDWLKSNDRVRGMVKDLLEKGPPSPDETHKH
jgi:hypothetical protein